MPKKKPKSIKQKWLKEPRKEPWPPPPPFQTCMCSAYLHVRSVCLLIIHQSLTTGITNCCNDDLLVSIYIIDICLAPPDSAQGLLLPTSAIHSLTSCRLHPPPSTMIEAHNPSRLCCSTVRMNKSLCLTKTQPLDANFVFFPAKGGVASVVLRPYVWILPPWLPNVEFQAPFSELSYSFKWMYILSMQPRSSWHPVDICWRHLKHCL